MKMAASKSVSSAIVLAFMLPFGAHAQTGAAASGGTPPAPMQERMKAMHAQMERINGAKDPQEREKLTQEHMQDCMQMMSAMGAAPHGTGGAAGRGAKDGGHSH